MINERLNKIIPAVLLSAMFSIGGQLQAGSIRTVALTAQPAPGTPTALTFSAFRAGYLPPSPLLNESGQTSFVAYLQGSGVDASNTLGIWSEGSGGPALLARQGDHAAGTAVGVNYDTLGIIGTPVLNDIGQTAFFAYLTGSSVDSTNNTGLWVGTHGNMALVARASNPAPGTPVGVTYRGVGPAALNNAGRIAFGGSLTGSGVDSTNDAGIWSQASGSVALLARSGSPAPGTAAGVTYNGFYPPALNDAGQSAFQASLTGSGVDSTNNQGIWADRSGSVALVARRGTQAPGVPVGVNFGGFSGFGFHSPVLNSAGQTAFLAGLTNGEQGIWSEGSGNLAPVAVSGSHAPGLPGGVNFIYGFGGPVLNDPGHTAFFATLTGSGVDSTNNQSVWSEGSGSLALLAREGNHAPGTPTGVNFNSFFTAADESPLLNNADQTAFLATLIGDSVDFTNDQGIWATDSTGTLQLIARTGGTLEVAPGDFRTIRQLDLVNGGGNRDGRPSGFNDSGQLAFSAMFTDDSQGIFVSNAVATPEPAALVLLTFTLPALLCRGLRMRPSHRLLAAKFYCVILPQRAH